MKNFYFQRFSKNLGSAFLIAAFSITSISHAQMEYDITPEISRKIIEDYGMRSFNVYPVFQKQIEVYGSETVQVESQRYRYVKDLIPKYQPDYDKYNAELERSKNGKETVNQIVSFLDEFLNSKEKYKKKEKFLEQAEEKAQTNQMEGVLSWHKKNNKPNSDTDLAMSLLSGSRVEDDEVIKYKQKLQQLTFAKPMESYGYLEYVKYMKELETVPKTEEGAQQSKTATKRMAYMKGSETMDIETLSGKFIEMPNFMLVTRDLPGSLVKDELLNEYPKIRTTNEIGEPFTLLRKKDTDEYFYIMSNEFISYLYQRQIRTELLNMIHKLGYKEYKDEYETLKFKSKTSEIYLDRWTYMELKKDPQYVMKLDTDQAKISSFVKQTIPHSKTLDKYLSLYNVQRNRMSSADLKAWRTATANAQKLQDQIHAINQKYDGNTSFTLLDKTITRSWNGFLDNLLSSKGVLGM